MIGNKTALQHMYLSKNSKKKVIPSLFIFFVVVVFLFSLIVTNSKDKITGGIVGVYGFDGGMFLSGGGLLFTSEASPNVSWNATYDGGDTDVAYGIAVDSNGSVYVTGHITTGLSNQNFYTVKYNSTGGLVWNVSYGSGTTERSYAIDLDSSGNVYVAGVLNTDVLVVKYNSTGDYQWNYTHSESSASDFIYSISINNSNIYATGYSDNITAGKTMIHTFKLTTGGSYVWNQTYDINTTEDDIAYGIKYYNDSAIYVVGESYGTGGDSDTDFWILVYNSNGQKVNEFSYDSGISNDTGRSIDINIESGKPYLYLTGGSTIGYLTLKLNSSGTHIWNTTYNSGGTDTARSIAVDSSNNVYVTGDANSDYYTIKYNSTGSQIWNATYDGGSVDTAYGIAVDSSGYVYVTGSRNNGGDTDFFTIKYDTASSDSTPPTISIVYPANNTNSSNNGLNINYTASDETSLDSCWYSNDTMSVNTSLTDCGTNITTITWSEGPHNVTVYVNDSSNNLNWSSVSFTIDTTPPYFNNLKNITHIVNISLSEDYSAVDSGVGIGSYKLNDSVYFNISNNGLITNITNLSRIEIHWLNLSVNDSLGNLNSTVFFINITKDTTAPVVNLLSPADSSSYTSNSQEITFVYNTSDTNSISSCSLIISGISNLTNTSISNGLNNNFTQTFTPGTYTWSVNCTDNSNNIGNSSIWSFSVTAPSSSGGGGGGGGGGGICTPKWKCKEWSDCIKGKQTKTCTDVYHCTKDKTETRDCGVKCVEEGVRFSILNEINDCCEGLEKIFLKSIYNEDCSKNIKGPKWIRCQDKKTIGEPVCGNNICEKGENEVICPDCIYQTPACMAPCRAKCPQDCEKSQSICSSIDNEKECNSKSECEGVYLGGEENYICSNCGNNICEEWENKCNCPNDCEIKEKCNNDEECRNSFESCNYECSDNTCIEINSFVSLGEYPDCEIKEIICGNGICEKGEDSENCPEDCKKKKEPDWECSEWSECNAVYNLNNIIQENIFLNGKQERICKDKNNNFPDKIERKKCKTKKEIIINKTKKCFKEYIEIYNLNENFVSSIDYSDNFGFKRLNLNFDFNQRDYCDYCSDGIKDYDEEGVDCGGKWCPECEEGICGNNICEAGEDEIVCPEDCKEKECITDKECKDKFESCYYKCIKNKCIPINTYTPISLGEYPDCEKDCSEVLCPDIAAPYCPDGKLISEKDSSDCCISSISCCGNNICETGENFENCPEDCKERPGCSKNSDCGTNEFIGNKICENHNIYQNFKSYNCINPGTINSACSSTIKLELVEKCKFGCMDGESECNIIIQTTQCSDGIDNDNDYLIDNKDPGCWKNLSNPNTYNPNLDNEAKATVTCSKNSDCATNEFTGNKYCLRNDVYQNYKEYSCENPKTGISKCTDKTTKKLVKDCTSRETCFLGKCIDKCLGFRLFRLCSKCSDKDKDGFDDCKIGDKNDDGKIIDCNDNNAMINPGVSETCNGIDDNCDGKIDENNGGCGKGSVCLLGTCTKKCEDIDKDGFDDCKIGDKNDDGKIIDCNDNDNKVYPGSIEICDNKDNDCNEKIDEDLTRPTTCGLGKCSGNTGIETCKLGIWKGDTCDPFKGSSNEVCEGKFDEDCDGSIDEGCECISGQTKQCGSTNIGECEYGKQTCDNGKWGECKGNIEPSLDNNCDNKDNDCDGKIDEHYISTKTTCGVGECKGNTGLMNCVNGQEINTCNPFEGAVKETCKDKTGSDGLDNNCDGKIDLNCNSYCDKDRDGYTDKLICIFRGYKTGDCNDNNAMINPGVSETCNGIDDNCDGKIDENNGGCGKGSVCLLGTCTKKCEDIDKDGFDDCKIGDKNDDGKIIDCNDNDNKVYPGSIEICDNKDNDCNEKIDENNACKKEKCTDSDITNKYLNGKNYYIKGKVVVEKDKKEDFCLNNKTLVEYYCLDKELKRQEFKCSKGCENGKCLIDSCEIFLTKGWNFISLCRESSDYSIDYILGNMKDKVEYILEWDENKQDFKIYTKKGVKEFKEFNKEKSYFIFSTKEGYLDYPGETISALETSIIKGWESPVFPLVKKVEIKDKFYGVKFNYILKWNRKEQKFEVYSVLSRRKMKLDPAEGLFIHSKGGVLKFNNSNN